MPLHYLRLRAPLKNGASLFALGFCLSLTAAHAANLPAAGHFVSGKGSLSKAHGTLTIDQTSSTGIIDWKSFSIGKNKSVDFANGGGATLNRVTGGNLSKIEGALTSSGSVYVMNSAGVLVGKTGHVDTDGTFVATSGNIDGDSFGAHRKLSIIGANANVTNRGSVTSNTGDVFLVGNGARNNGTLNAKTGTAGLAAGTSVLIAPSGSNGRIEVRAGTGSATSSGAIDAASAELRAANGNVYALAGNNGGMINAIGTKDIAGHIWLTSSAGKTEVAGTLTSRNADGTGGAIETSGSNVSLNGTVDAGKGGQWLVDPENLTVGKKAAAKIDTALNAGTNVTLQTTKTGTSGPGTASSGAGDIKIDSALDWNTTATLTLQAYRNVTISSGIDVAGQGGVSILTGATGKFFFSGGALDFSDLNSTLTVNGAAYALVGNIASLATDIFTNAVGNYALAGNYDATADGTYAKAPISNTFKGHFEGLGHTISNLTIDDEKVGAQLGLFAHIAATGFVENIVLKKETLTGSTQKKVDGPWGSLGGLAALNAGSIFNASANAHIEIGGNGKSYFGAGGLVGTNNGFIDKSSSSGTIEAGLRAALGGLVGQQGGDDDHPSAITRSHSSATVKGLKFSQLGGLCGECEGTISDSYATGNVTGGDNVQAGGLVGWLFGTITNSHATGDVVAANGRDTGIFTSAGNEDVGGFAGFLNGGSISGSYATGDVTVGVGSFLFAGGFIGDNEGSITTSHATGKVTSGTKWEGQVEIGGFAGENGYGPISDSYATGNVVGGNAVYAGGFAGQNFKPLTNDYATGSVKAGKGSTAGGFVGYTEDDISNAYANGDVTIGSAYKDTHEVITATAGGFAGISAYGSITNAYALGNVSAGQGAEVGGFVGGMNNSATIKNAYAIGAVTAGTGSRVGGFVGVDNVAEKLIKNAYWDITTSGIDASHGAGNHANREGMTGETTDVLLSGVPEGFSTKVWAIDPKINGGLPYLIALKDSY